MLLPNIFQNLLKFNTIIPIYNVEGEIMAIIFCTIRRINTIRHSTDDGLAVCESKKLLAVVSAVIRERTALSCRSSSLNVRSSLEGAEAIEKYQHLW